MGIGHLPKTGRGESLQFEGGVTFQVGGRRSPRTTSTTVQIRVPIPKGATRMIVMATTNTYFNNHSAGTMADADGQGYDYMPAYQKDELPCADVTAYWFKAVTAAGSLYFRFQK